VREWRPESQHFNSQQREKEREPEIEKVCNREERGHVSRRFMRSRLI